jgi:general secretion pathway protein F
MPIEEALRAVAEQTEKQRVATLIMAIRSKVLEGYTLAASLREHSKSFNSLFCSTVAAGEQSGYLSKVLENLADYIERQYEATSSVQSALFYPATVLALAFLIVGALMVYVVPDMVNVIIDSGQELPWFTLILIDMTDFLSAFWWLLVAGMFGTVFLIRWLLSQAKARLWWDKFKFSLPLIAKVTRNSNAASYTNTLSILTRSGVPLVDAMAIAGDVVSNAWLRKGLIKATQTVSEGVALKTSLEEIGQFPPMMLHMIAAGEQSGELDEMLSRVALFQQKEVERVLGAVLKLIEPVMLLIMGGIVLFIVMAVMLPMLSMNQMV